MSDTDQQLADLLVQLADRAQQGHEVNLDEQCRLHPELADELRRLWGTVLVTQAIGHPSASGDSSATREPSQIPTLPAAMGDYVLEEELGRGGMGVVYRARQLSLNRNVAIKMLLHGDRALDSERSRFRNEAQSAARLTHPNIVTITEVGEHDGQDYIAMELIRGGTLAQRLAAGPLPPREAALLLLPVARAVHFAHQQGVLHRDLKPSNILIGTSGNPYVADFGLAHRHEDPGAGRGEGAMGTPAYMAPEQAAGNSAAIGPASDIYSLGAVLYHMLTGRPPFQGATVAETLLLGLEQDPLPPRMLNRRVDRDLEMIALRCLQKPPDLRYPSAAALADDLQAYLDDQPVSAWNGRLTDLVARLLRDTHQAAVLENWGLLWMWHSLVLLLMCGATNWLHWLGDTDRWHYWSLWTVGFGAWAAVVWWLRRRRGLVTSAERGVAHVWLASMISVACLFPLEAMLGLPVLSLSPVLGLVAGSAFLGKAGMLSGMFYLPAGLLFVTAFAMARWPDIAQVLFGLVCGGCFFFPGLKYHARQRAQRATTSAARATAPTARS